MQRTLRTRRLILEVKTVSIDHINRQAKRLQRFFPDHLALHPDGGALSDVQELVAKVHGYPSYHNAATQQSARAAPAALRGTSHSPASATGAASQLDARVARPGPIREPVRWSELLLKDLIYLQRKMQIDQQKGSKDGELAWSARAYHLASALLMLAVYLESIQPAKEKLEPEITLYGLSQWAYRYSENEVLYGYQFALRRYLETLPGFDIAGQGKLHDRTGIKGEDMHLSDPTAEHHGYYLMQLPSVMDYLNHHDRDVEITFDVDRTDDEWQLLVAQAASHGAFRIIFNGWHWTIPKMTDYLLRQGVEVRQRFDRRPGIAFPTSIFWYGWRHDVFTCGFAPQPEDEPSMLENDLGNAVFRKINVIEFYGDHAWLPELTERAREHGIEVVKMPFSESDMFVFMPPHPRSC